MKNSKLIFFISLFGIILCVFIELNCFSRIKDKIIQEEENSISNTIVPKYNNSLNQSAKNPIDIYLDNIETASIKAPEKNESEEILEDNDEAEDDNNVNVILGDFVDNTVDNTEENNVEATADNNVENNIIVDIQTDIATGLQNDNQIPETASLNIIPQATEVTEPAIFNGHVVAIDPGHQLTGNYEKEPVGPGSSTMKNKVAAGTYGRTTLVPEYQLTLTVSLLLKEELIKRGYQVVMTRETNEVNITNAERAILANNSGAEIFVRIHADGSDNSSAKGMMAICPTSVSPYCQAIYSDSRLLSDLLLLNMFASTNTSKGRIWETDTMSGINWCTIPVSIIEMGYMTNPEEDVLMETLEYQLKLVDGIANGIDAYFTQK